MSIDRRILLDLLWPRTAAEQADRSRLSPAQWQAVDHTAAQHRLRPLLAARAAKAGDWSAPPALLERWSRAYRQAARKSLLQRSELQRIECLFAKAGLLGTVLKGGAYVWSSGTAAGLRPLRDLDILLPAQGAATAHQLLQEHGFAVVAHPADHIQIDTDKHLPPLASPLGVFVELHNRLIDTPQTGRGAAEAIWREAMIARARTHSGGTISASCPTDTLLHVLLHSVLDHHFNNGPLLLLDLELLIDRAATPDRVIDWALLWAEADRLDARKACELALHLGQARGLCVGVEWPAIASGYRAPTPRLLRRCEMLMVVDAVGSRELGWAARIVSADPGERLTRLRAMMKRRFRTTQVMPDEQVKERVAARIGGQDPTSVMATIGQLLGKMMRPSFWIKIWQSMSVSFWLSLP